MNESSSAGGALERLRFRRFLVLGLGFSAVLLLAAVTIALRTVRQIDLDTRTFATQQELAKRGIDDIEQQQAALNERWVQLARKKDLVRREEILDQLTESRTQMSVALEGAYERAELLRESIYQQSHGLLRWTVWLFALCVMLSILCGVWAARASTLLFGRLQIQAADLSRLQYQFLETQEHTARRFSHELHDELGQVLTAIKANLSALGKGDDPARIEDCKALVDRAIQDVREMSQLLRPTMLDDFGLDAALRSLAESFSQRTGIATEYEGDATGSRFGDMAETNLYRIAQEALTNIARHSQATQVNIQLTARPRDVTLAISDNGIGLKPSPAGTLSRGLGLAGMETRARGCGGTLHVQSPSGGGVKIEVTCPINQ